MFRFDALDADVLVSRNKWIQHVPAAHTPQAAESKRPSVIEKTIKSIEDEPSVAPWAFHRLLSFLPHTLPAEGSLTRIVLVVQTHAVRVLSSSPYTGVGTFLFPRATRRASWSPCEWTGTVWEDSRRQRKSNPDASMHRCRE